MLLKNYLQVPQCAFFRKQLLSHRTLCCQARVRGVSVVRIHAKGRPESRPLFASVVIRTFVRR